MSCTVWADHADYVSKAYSGTGALKTDFTRTGKRTKQGLLQDGQNSIVRYLRNNYFDGDRQDAFDLFTGAWLPARGPATALALVTDGRPLITQAVSVRMYPMGHSFISVPVIQMPYVLFFSVFMIFAGMILPRQSSEPLTPFHIMLD